MQKGPITSFYPIERVSENNHRTTVCIKLGPEVVQIISVEEQVIFHGTRAITNDVFHISDVDAVALGRFGYSEENENEFRIRYNNGTFRQRFRADQSVAVRIVRVSIQVRSFH